jgi:hypothetical protein
MFPDYDWHIGHTLYGRKRYGEYEAFLDWPAVIIHLIANREEKIPHV